MLENLELYQELIKRKSVYIGKIDALYVYVKNALPKINRVFANYTGHGIEHSFHIMQNMFF